MAIKVPAAFFPVRKQHHVIVDEDKWARTHDVYIVVVYEQVDAQTVYPVTAYEINEKEFSRWLTKVEICRGAES
jgi:hypothetical protein